MNKYGIVGASEQFLVIWPPPIYCVRNFPLHSLTLKDHSGPGSEDRWKKLLRQIQFGVILGSARPCTNRGQMRANRRKEKSKNKTLIANIFEVLWHRPLPKRFYGTLQDGLQAVLALEKFSLFLGRRWPKSDTRWRRPNFKCFNCIEFWRTMPCCFWVPRPNVQQCADFSCEILSGFLLC